MISGQPAQCFGPVQNCCWLIWVVGYLCADLCGTYGKISGYHVFRSDFEDSDHLATIISCSPTSSGRINAFQGALSTLRALNFPYGLVLTFYSGMACEVRRSCDVLCIRCYPLRLVERLAHAGFRET